MSTAQVSPHPFATISAIYCGKCKALKGAGAVTVENRHGPNSGSWIKCEKCGTIIGMTRAVQSVAP